MMRKFTIVALFLATTMISAQQKRAATVAYDGSDILSGPAFSFPSVGKVNKGERLLVYGEEGEFLIVQAPPSCKSWIRAVHLGEVKLDDRGMANVEVRVNDAEVRVGDARGDMPSDIARLRLPKDTIVEVIGKPVRVDNSKHSTSIVWYPIIPPEGDYRYIARKAVEPTLVAIVSPSTVVKESPTAGVVSLPKETLPSGTQGLPKILTENPLWPKAEYAERLLDYAKAEELYTKIYYELYNAKADHDAQVICYNRITRCREERLKEKSNRTSTVGERPVPTQGTSARPDTEGGWLKPATLRRIAKLNLDGKQLFGLYDDRGEPVYYVTASAGVNLDQYDAQKVRLFGTTHQRGDLARPHFLVQQAEIAK
ncbi:MAG: hypothetical protein R3B84_15880 [Zavarzinella sp.]